VSHVDDMTFTLRLERTIAGAHRRGRKSHQCRQDRCGCAAKHSLSRWHAIYARIPPPMPGPYPLPISLAHILWPYPWAISLGHVLGPCRPWQPKNESTEASKPENEVD